MIETRFGTIRLEREYSKRRNRPVAATAHFFQGMEATKVADLFREDESTALIKGRAVSGKARCWSEDKFCWREGNKTAIAKALFATTLTKDQRREIWGEIATQMNLAGKKNRK